MADDLRRAVTLYNRGHYFESQQAFESAFTELDEADQPFAKALLMLATAMHLYFNRGGGRGTLNLLRQSLVILDGFRPEHLGVAVDELFDTVQAYLQDLESRKSREPRFIDRWLVPQIRVRR